MKWLMKYLERVKNIGKITQRSGNTSICAFLGQISWSRIATFFAFGARLAQFCVENQMNDLVRDVVTNMSQLAVEKLTPFLRENGGWVRFSLLNRYLGFSLFSHFFQGTLCEAFPMQSDYEGKLWRSLVFTGMGLTAIATLLALQRSSA